MMLLGLSFSFPVFKEANTMLLLSVQNCNIKYNYSNLSNMIHNLDNLEALVIDSFTMTVFNWPLLLWVNFTYFNHTDISEYLAILLLPLYDLVILVVWFL